MPLTDRAREIIEKYDLKPPFIRKEAQADFYYVDFAQPTWKEWAKYLGLDFVLCTFFFIRHNLVYVYYTATGLQKWRDFYLSLAKDPEFIARHYRDWRNSIDNLESSISTLQPLLETGPFKELVPPYLDFCEKYIRQYSFGIIPEAFGLEPEKWITPEVELYCQINNLDINTVFPVLTSPIVLSFITEEEIESLQLALKHVSAGKTTVLDEEIVAHQEKWFWLRNNYSDIRILPLDHFREPLKEYMRLSADDIQTRIANLKELPNAHSAAKQKLFDDYPPSDKLRLYVKLNEMFAEMQDIRKMYVLKTNHYHQCFLQRSSTEYSVLLSDLIYYSYKEVKQLLSRGTLVTAEEIAARRQSIFAITDDHDQAVISGEESEGMYDEVSEKHEHVESFKGVIAQKGKVTGIARIVMRSVDISKVQEGDIIVSSMTRPEMIAAMNKAAAFVTDEGGITCHAAIVARELKKPCIIGTKVATKILKDGDRIEVDADNGVITIVKN